MVSVILLFVLGLVLICFGGEDWDPADCCRGYDCEYWDDAAGDSGVYDGGF